MPRKAMKPENKEMTLKSKILETNQPIEPTVVKKGLPGFVQYEKLSTQDTNYNIACNMLKYRLEAPEKEKLINIKVLLDWYQVRYTQQYGYPCLDFNYFNAVKTFKNLLLKYEYLENFNGLCYMIAIWFLKASELNIDLSVYVLKTPWILDKLTKETQHTFY